MESKTNTQVTSSTGGVLLQGQNKIAGDVKWTKHVDVEQNFFNISNKQKKKFKKHYCKVKEALQSHYIKKTTKVKDRLWKLDSPDAFAPDFYVDLNFFEYQKSRWVLLDNKHVNLAEEFRVTSQRNIMIIGAPGSGKTTFCKELAYRWANGASEKSILPVDSILLIYFELASLEESDSVENSLLLYLSQLANLDMQVTKNALQSTGDKIVILFDGLDELSESNRRRLLDFIAKKDGTSNSLAFQNVILTTRNGIKIIHETDHFSCILHIDGLSGKNQRKLVTKYFVGEEKKQKRFVTFLDKLSEEYGKVGSPLLLSLLCDYAYRKPVKELYEMDELPLDDLIPKICSKFVRLGAIRNKYHLSKSEKSELVSKFLKLVNVSPSESLSDEVLREEFGNDAEVIKASGVLQIEPSSFTPTSTSITYRLVHRMFCWKRDDQSPWQSLETGNNWSSSSSGSEGENNHSQRRRNKFQMRTTQMMETTRNEISRLSKDIKYLKFMQLVVFVLIALTNALTQYVFWRSATVVPVSDARPLQSLAALNDTQDSCLA